MDRVWAKYHFHRWRRGKKKKPPFDDPYLFVLDPDFDEDELEDCFALWRHEIATAGAITLHPDGDRRSAADDPVPLCSHVPDGRDADSEFIDLKYRARLAREHLQRKAEEKAQRKAEREARYQAVLVLPEPPAEAPRYQVRRPVWDDPGDPMGELLRNMRISDPVVAKMGRVWGNYVMINEIDRTDETIEPHWVEVWRGHKMIIFKMVKPASGLIHRSFGS